MAAIDPLNPLLHAVYRGGSLPRVAEDKLYEYWLAGNGLFVHAENSIMSALVQVEQFIVRGLPSLHPHVALRHRPFSSKMLYNILAHASRFPLREVTYQVLREKNRYVARLVQVGTAGGSGDFVDLDGDVVMQIHTHNQMPAFWSLTDDAH